MPIDRPCRKAPLRRLRPPGSRTESRLPRRPLPVRGRNRRKVAQRVVFMDAGVVVEEGPPNEVMVHPGTERFGAFLQRYEGMMAQRA